MTSMVNYFLPHFSAYRASYSMHHVFLCLTEEWKTNLDNNFIEGEVLMDMSKAFHSIPRNLLIAKLAVYGFDKKTLYLFILGKWKTVSKN